ncbi:DUF2239 family protein [Tautonia sp. JC769]|uniref:DUF2239 family protein n=1 Tax=Tautonia sp. JC769 TaxID=3232135 RepID=UPI0034597FEF
MDEERSYTVFAGERRITTADRATMLRETKAYLDGDDPKPVLIFEDQTGKQVDFDFRGTTEEVLARADAAGSRRQGPGRPKLGVVAREVTLLPRHWDWLERQPSGASAALRRLVDEARKREPHAEQTRRALEAASTFMWSMAGNLPGFQEASRALFARDRGRFDRLIDGWPEDIRDHLKRLVEEPFRVDGEGAGAEVESAGD